MAKGQIFKGACTEDEAERLWDFQEMFKGKSGAEESFQPTGLFSYLHAFENPTCIFGSFINPNIRHLPPVAPPHRRKLVTSVRCSDSSAVPLGQR